MYFRVTHTDVKTTNKSKGIATPNTGEQCPQGGGGTVPAKHTRGLSGTGEILVFAHFISYCSHLHDVLLFTQKILYLKFSGKLPSYLLFQCPFSISKYLFIQNKTNHKIQYLFLRSFQGLSILLLIFLSFFKKSQ